MEKYVSKLNKLIKSEQKNFLESIYWIYDYETLFHGQSYYIKIYLINSKHNELLPSRLDLSIISNQDELNYNTFEFYPIQEMKGDNNYFGTLVKLGPNVINVESIHISGYIINNRFYDNFSNEVRVEKPINHFPHKINYINSKFELGNFLVYPQLITESAWICKCGAVNNENICSECLSNKEDFFLYEKTPIDKFITTKFKDNKFNINPKDSLDRNLKDHFSVLKELKVDYNEYFDEKELNRLEEEYNSLQKKNIDLIDKSNIPLDTDNSFDDNIKNFLKEKKINEENRTLIFNNDELEILKVRYDKILKQKNKKKKLLLCMTTLLIATILSLSYYFLSYLPGLEEKPLVQQWSGYWCDVNNERFCLDIDFKEKTILLINSSKEIKYDFSVVDDNELIIEAAINTFKLKYEKGEIFFSYNESSHTIFRKQND